MSEELSGDLVVFLEKGLRGSLNRQDSFRSSGPFLSETWSNWMYSSRAFYLTVHDLHSAYWSFWRN